MAWIAIIGGDVRQCLVGYRRVHYGARQMLSPTFTDNFVHWRAWLWYAKMRSGPLSRSVAVSMA